ncbi:orexin receptor type 1-like [Coccinella septempunctata]|uniref:orexin receptor type 1-like n=1 Tax=Coccinella septempunctata TaxID=41139 RepID=UPI001D067001|nr:orexin receptor type 1-like [Coccinella septempunctata]
MNAVMRFEPRKLPLLWFLSSSVVAETILHSDSHKDVQRVKDDHSYSLYRTYTNSGDETNPSDQPTDQDYDLVLQDYLDSSEGSAVGVIQDQNDTSDGGNYNYTYNLEEIEQYIFPKTWTWFLIFFHGIVFIVGIVGNFLVCVAVYRNHTMRTVTNYFIVNLAVADFLVILFCLPPSVVWDVTMTWFFGVIMCKTVLYFQSVSVTVSVLTLTFISIDRWYAICFPLKFKSTTGRAKTAIGIIWMLSLSTSLPEMIYSTTKPREGLGFETVYFTQCKPSWSIQTDTYFTIVRMIFSYAFPLLFMSVAYIQIIKVLWKSGTIPHQVIDVSGRHVNSFAMNMNASTEGQLKSRKKAAKMLVVVVAMFAICYFPVHLLSLLRLTVELRNSEANRAVAMISHWLCYANSAVNPIIYNFMSGKFRKEFQSSFSKCSANEHSEGNGRTSTYIYRYTANRQSTRSRTEIIPLNNIHTKIN